MGRKRSKDVLDLLSQFVVVMTQVITQLFENVPHVFGEVSYSLWPALLHHHSEEINYAHKQTKEIVINQLLYDEDRSSNEILYLSFVCEFSLV